jgi:hypothetical protein
MKRKSIGRARSKVVIDVPVELDMILKRHRKISLARVAEQVL